MLTNIVNIGLMLSVFAPDMDPGLCLSAECLVLKFVSNNQQKLRLLLSSSCLNGGISRLCRRAELPPEPKVSLLTSTL